MDYIITFLVPYGNICGAYNNLRYDDSISAIYYI